MEIRTRDPVTISLPDGWIVYFQMIDDFVTSVFVDIALEKKFSREQFSRVTILEFKFAGNNAGLTTDAEEAQLDNLTETFESLANAQTSFFARIFGRSTPRIIFAGRETRNCIRRCFYYSAEDISNGVFEALHEKFRTCEIRVLSKADPTWADYRTHLHPGVALNPLFLTWAELDMRGKNGDKLNEPREVLYDVEFSTQKDREAFLSAVAKEDWRTQSRTNPEGSEKGWAAGVVRRQRLDRLWSDVLIVALCSRLAAYNGKFMGRGAPEVH